MAFLFVLSAIILFLIITKNPFFKRKYSNKQSMQIGMLILVGTITVFTIFTSQPGDITLSSIVVGMGIMSFIAILIDMTVSKNK